MIDCKFFARFAKNVQNNLVITNKKCNFAIAFLQK